MASQREGYQQVPVAMPYGLGADMVSHMVSIIPLLVEVEKQAQSAELETSICYRSLLAATSNSINNTQVPHTYCTSSNLIQRVWSVGRTHHANYFLGFHANSVLVYVESTTNL